MPLTVTEIQREAGSLTLEDKERLIGFLIASLEAPDEGDIEAAWEEEALRRSHEIHEGGVVPVSLEEALERVRQNLRRS